jgi:hypothetical protein
MMSPNAVIIVTIGILLCCCNISMCLVPSSLSWGKQKCHLSFTRRKIRSSKRMYTEENEQQLSTRRIILQTGLIQIAVATTTIPRRAQAYPMISSDEFDIILRDSSRSIGVVEFSGPKSENIKVVLVDGTEFGVSGIVESSTDPRSPLKIAARCRENSVRTKFVDYESALSSIVSQSGKKKVAYTNTRVQEAFVKEQEKQARLQEDEQNRLLELYRQQQLEQK